MSEDQLKSTLQRAINAYRLLIIDEIGYLPMSRLRIPTNVTSHADERDRWSVRASVVLKV